MVVASIVRTLELVVKSLVLVVRSLGLVLKAVRTTLLTEAPQFPRTALEVVLHHVVDLRVMMQ